MLKTIVFGSSLAALLVESGFALSQTLEMKRGDIRQLLPSMSTRVVHAVIVLGDADCRNVVTFLAMLEGLPSSNEHVARLILVSGPDSTRQRVTETLENMAMDATVGSITRAQLRGLGIRPTHHIGRFVLLDRRANVLLLTPLPSSPRELASTVAVASSVISYALHD